MPISTSDGADIDLVAALRAEARATGFDAIGIAPPDATGAAGARLAEWIDLGHHGTMGWMEDRLSWRQDPRTLWPDVRSVIMLADSYAPDEDPMDRLAQSDRAVLSVYAGNRDYHDVVKKRLKRLGRWLIDRAGGEIKVFVDTAPVMEKPLAEAAGLGWQGKHTNLVSRELGSWFFLGAIFTTVRMRPDGAEADHCGRCRRCLDICPTAAFPSPGVLDARRCISYLTIEHKGHIPRGLRAAIGNRVYGCDDCLAVCPWNKFSRTAHEAYSTRPELRSPRLSELLDLDDAGFRELFRASPVKRIGWARFMRNVLVAAGNSEEAKLSAGVAPHLVAEDARVRVAAVWALSRLMPAEAVRKSFSDIASLETDPDVRVEWGHALTR